jgi:dolichol-phosphate mannosyltransferase
VELGEHIQTHDESFKNKTMTQGFEDNSSSLTVDLEQLWLSHIDLNRIAVVIPCYKVSEKIIDVLNRIGPEVWRIFAIDDNCPDHSGALIENQCKDPRVTVIRLTQNLGVGGAVMRGYEAAFAAGAKVIVKIDGDGQMDPNLLPSFVWPIVNGHADYTKGNRFFHLDEIGRMPAVRLFGNAALSFINKLSSGYWDVFDPTNGYTAIHAQVAKNLPLEKISQRYFFESDMLFRLNTLKAVVLDIPMSAHYGDEVSNLKIRSIVGEFFTKNLRNFFKRIFYNYYLRDVSLASFELPLGVLFSTFGIIFGAVVWYASAKSNIPTPLGTIMLAALPTLLGSQFLLAFFSHDMSTVPKVPIQRRLPYWSKNTPRNESNTKA